MAEFAHQIEAFKTQIESLIKCHHCQSSHAANKCNALLNQDLSKAYLQAPLNDCTLSIKTKATELEAQVYSMENARETCLRLVYTSWSNTFDCLNPEESLEPSEPDTRSLSVAMVEKGVADDLNKQCDDSFGTNKDSAQNAAEKDKCKLCVSRHLGGPCVPLP